jgi:signal transduction histidine kinase
MRLFQPFRKSARDAANSASGIGLGLALSRRLARQLDGELALEDGDARGACFVLNLPLATEN